MHLIPKQIAHQPDSVIKLHYDRAFSHRAAYAHSAITCGQMLIEKRQDMADERNDCTKFSVDAENALPNTTFDEWAVAICDSRCRRTLYYWMSAADRVIKHLLEKSPSDDSPVFLRSDPETLISTLLTAGADALKTFSTRALAFRDQFDAFMADKTLADANIAVLEGFSEAKRITLAANGKQAADGDQGDRKDFPLYIARHFSDISSHFAHWEAMNATQRTEAATIVRAMIIGDETKLTGRKGASFKFVAWPPELRAAAREAIAEANRQSKTADTE